MGWGAKGKLKHLFRHKWQCCAFSRQQKLTHSTGQAKIAVKRSLVSMQFYKCASREAQALKYTTFMVLHIWLSSEASS